MDKNEIIKNEIELNDDVIISKIYSIRGVRVMLDSDLSLVYGVETKILNRAVKRNLNRFVSHLILCFS